MRYTISGKNINITPGLKDAVESKLGKLERYFSPDTEVQVTLSVEKGRQKIEVTIPVKGSIIRAEQDSNDMYVSVDLVEEIIERQIKKYKTKIVDKKQSALAFSEAFLQEEAEQEGGIDADESTLIRSAIGFMDLETSDIYTPRVDIESIPLDATKEEIAKMFLDTGFSRLPVYEEDIDHIIGIINQKDFHNFIYHTDRPLKDIIRPVLFITPTMKIGVLLKKLQDSKTHIAIILDEFGGTEGLVTIEDIIEELVGDIWDEHDRVIKEIEKISDREYLMSGSANIDKVFELLDIEKAVDVNTLSGWIMEELGQIPKEGDSFVSDGVKVVVLKMDDHRVDKAKVYQNVQNNAENEGNQEK